MKLGLTGGIGCGKSTAGRMFAELGWQRMDSDEIVRELLTGDSEIQAAVRRRWGGDCFLDDGSIDRAAVARIVFNDKPELTWWEGVIHPRVRQTWLGAIERDPGQDWLIEIPLLFEKDLSGHFARTICVEANETTQLARLAAKGLDRAQSVARIRNQLPVLDKARRANHVLSNSGSIDFLQRQIGHLSELLRRSPC